MTRHGQVGPQFSRSPPFPPREKALEDLASVFLQQSASAAGPSHRVSRQTLPIPLSETRHFSNLEARYRALVEQIPAVVFMANLDRGIGEAYVSPQIEAALGFSQEEWLEDPVRWYSHIHPGRQKRWSTEAAEMFLTGQTSAVGLSRGRPRWPSPSGSIAKPK